MNAAGSPLSSLRQDYRSEYVLMAAEVFHKDQDVNAAAQRIASLGTQTPAEITARAAEFARTSGYSLNDLELMNALSEALNTLPAPNGAGK